MKEITLRVRRPHRLEPSTHNSGIPNLDRQPENSLGPGTVLEGRYEVLRVIGRGGMSVVYLARDLRFNHVDRFCAIKEMFNRDANEETRLLRLANFEQEAALLATLSHPAIPKIYDYFSTGGLIYLVLEYIEGEDLEGLLARRETPFPEETLIEWALQILDVVAYLHEHQPAPVVFRDLKPSNIMLRSDGAISLIDFGIARTFQPLHRGTMVGTEGYAPPEQYRGIAEPRGDIYALGATLHHLVTRSDPRSEPPFSFHQRPPKELNPEISDAFQAIIQRALSYNVSDRFPSAAEMAQAIIEARTRQEMDSALEHRSPSIGTPRTSKAMVTQHDPRATRKQENEASSDRILWSVQTGDEVRGTPLICDGRVYIGSYDRHLYSLNLRDGAIGWRFHADRGIVSRPLMREQVIIIGSEDHTVYALRQATGRVLWSLRTAMPVRSSAAAFEEAIVIGSDDGYCYCLDVEHGNLIWRYRTWGPMRSSPLVVGREIVVGSDDGSVHSFSAVDGRPIWRTPVGGPVLSSPAVAGATVIVGGMNGRLIGLDLKNGDHRWTLQTKGPLIASPRVAGETAFIGSTDGAVYAVSVLDGSPVWESRISNQITASLAIDGQRGIVGTIDGNLFCLDLESGETIWSHKIGSPIVSTTAVEAGVAVLGAMDGRIYGLHI